MSGFKYWNSYKLFEHRIRHQRRYFRTQEDDDFLQQILGTSKSRVRILQKDSPLFRAQLGHDLQSINENEQDFKIPVAYPPERMKPLANSAIEGRANPKGIPVLYTANRMKTAISEVRPWVGSLVSCAQFKTTRALKIVDLSIYHSEGTKYYFSEPDDSERDKAVWTHIDQAFSKPTTSGDDTAEYVPTQVIAELFKNNGFDGIAYKSVFGDDGYNLALFDLADAELTNGCLYQVKDIDLSFEQIDNPYWVDAKGRMNTITIKPISPSEPSAVSNS